MEAITFEMKRGDGVAGSAGGRRDSARFARRMALGFLLALMCYQMALCFLNTRGMAVSDNLVAACEMVVLLGMAAWVVPQRRIADFAIPSLVAASLILMWAFRGEADLYGPRDLTIIILSYWLGQTVRARRDVNRIVTIIFCVVCFFACMEYFATAVYVKVFDILKYAVARGVVDQTAASYVHNNLFISGIRMGGRNILPFLGNQRVSSVFFEPVSMGNFGVVLAMWGLSFDKADRREMFRFLAMAAFAIIACDGRFASSVVFILILLRLVPLFQSRPLLLLYPVVLLVGLVEFTLAKLVSGLSDDLPGRVMRTGQILVDLDVYNIFGLTPVHFFGDSGIPYSIEMFGTVLCACLWIIFVFRPVDTAQGRRLKAMTAVYCLCLLLISGRSFYSSKTDALLWFLVGAVSRVPLAGRTPDLATTAPRRDQAPDVAATAV